MNRGASGGSIVDSIAPPGWGSKPETQSRKLETQNPKLETRNPKLETRNPKPETRNSKPETRNPKLPLHRRPVEARVQAQCRAEELKPLVRNQQHAHRDQDRATGVVKRPVMSLEPSGGMKAPLDKEACNDERQPQPERIHQ